MWPGKNPSYFYLRVLDFHPFHMYLWSSDKSLMQGLLHVSLDISFGSRDIVLHENQTIDDIEKLTKFFVPSFSAKEIVPNPIPT